MPPSVKGLSTVSQLHKSTPVPIAPYRPLCPGAHKKSMPSFCIEIGKMPADCAVSATKSTPCRCASDAKARSGNVFPNTLDAPVQTIAIVLGRKHFWKFSTVCSSVSPTAAAVQVHIPCKRSASNGLTTALCSKSEHTKCPPRFARPFMAVFSASVQFLVKITFSHCGKSKKSAIISRA